MGKTKGVPAVMALAGRMTGRFVEAPDAPRIDPWAAERAERSATKAAAAACREQRASEGASYAAKRAALVAKSSIYMIARGRTYRCAS